MEKNQSDQNDQVIKIPQNLETFSYFNTEQFATMQRIATMLSYSELVPTIYKATSSNKDKAIANCILALDISNRIGANILMVMQNLSIIKGNIAWSSKFLIGTVNTCGRFEPLRFKFTELGMIEKVDYLDYEWSQGQNKMIAVPRVFDGPVQNIRCVAYTTKKGSQEILEGSPISVELAIKEGWYTKNGSKWPNMTKQMLMYRAASFWTSVYAPELSLGMKTIEEVGDIVDADFETIIENDIKKNANKNKIDIDLQNDGGKEEAQPSGEPEKTNLEKPEAGKEETKTKKRGF